uniref:Ataxin 7 like 2 n=1 Tax=Homo sapiens TaxID=9606 RepID=A0A804HI28_HUMAN
MAVRERAAAAMAALERRVPSLDDFAGQSWSSWVERADLPAADGAELEESSKNTKKLDAMTLIKEGGSRHTLGLGPRADRTTLHFSTTLQKEVAA